MTPRPSLLHNDLLILDQLRGWPKVDFDIEDANGMVVGQVRGTDSGASRFWRGPREFDLLDADGTPLAHISDVPNWGRDTMEVSSNGMPLATVRRQLGFFVRRITVDLVSGEQFLMEGNAFDREFRMADETTGMAVATGSRERVGFSRAFFGQDRYTLKLAPNLGPEQRVAVIATMVALDLMRRKGNNSAVASSSSH